MSCSKIAAVQRTLHLVTQLGHATSTHHVPTLVRVTIAVALTTTLRPSWQRVAAICWKHGRAAGLYIGGMFGGMHACACMVGSPSDTTQTTSKYKREGTSLRILCMLQPLAALCSKPAAERWLLLLVEACPKHLEARQTYFVLRWGLCMRPTGPAPEAPALLDCPAVNAPARQKTGLARCALR